MSQGRFLQSLRNSSPSFEPAMLHPTRANSKTHLLLSKRTPVLAQLARRE
jgi:hypothetical protein